MGVDDVTEQRRAEALLRESEAKFQAIFENTPVSLWEEDFSQVKKYLDGLGENGVSDLASYFDEHPEALAECASRIRIIDVNQATLDLYGVESKNQLFSAFDRMFRSDSLESFSREVIAFSRGERVYESEFDSTRFDGERITGIVSVSLAPGFEETWRRVFVSVTDISDRKRAEETIAEQARESELLHTTTQIAAESDSFEEALQQCIDAVCEQIGWPVGHAYLMAEDRSVLEPSRIWHIQGGENHAAFRETTEITTFARGIGRTRLDNQCAE